MVHFYNEKLEHYKLRSGVVHLLETFVDNGLFCCITGCSNNSVKKPGLSFHRLPLNKTLLKVWIHKIGQKNLPVNDNTQVCSKQLVNSAGRQLRKNEFPLLSLPVLPISKTIPVKRKSLRKPAEGVGD